MSELLNTIAELCSTVVVFSLAVRLLQASEMKNFYRLVRNAIEAICARFSHALRSPFDKPIRPTYCSVALYYLLSAGTLLASINFINGLIYPKRPLDIWQIAALSALLCIYFVIARLWKAKGDRELFELRRDRQ
jgi:hypothetical protein